MIKRESIADLKQAMSEGPISLIDVRETFEYAMGHVPGAVNSPLSTLAKDYTNLDKEQFHHIICQSGGRSAQAVMFLEQQGFKVINVDGGTMAWPDALDK